MNTVAVVLEEPFHLGLRTLELTEPGDDEVVVDVEWSGISTGTERLLWSGRMPPFPGLGYPLVPGYESVGRIASAGSASGRSAGECVFIAGARCYREARGLFGGAAARLIVPGSKAVPVGEGLERHGVLLALAATAYHAVWGSGGAAPELIVGHGALGRLLARLTLAMDHPAPVVWERLPDRLGGARGYEITAPDADARRDYRSIYDVSGDASLLDGLIARLAPGGQIVLAGFYSEPIAFQFPPAFMRETRLRVAAEWRPPDLAAVTNLIQDGRLALEGLVTHSMAATDAASAYATAFADPSCIKMVLDWRPRA